MKNKIKIWVSAFRLRTLPLALASMLSAGFLAKLPQFNVFSWRIFLLCCGTTISLQILSNLANDYGDAQNGADNVDRKGPKRAVSSGEISAESMKIGIIAFIIISLILGVSLLYVCFEKFDYTFFIFLLLGIICIISAIKYTAGKNPYGYQGLGDLAVFLFFGPVAVIGSFYLYSGIFSLTTIPISISFGLLATAVLNANNIRDIETDSASGKTTIAVKLGKKSSIIYQISIIIISAWILLTFIFIYTTNLILINLIFITIFSYIVINNFKLQSTQDAEKQTNILKQTALSTFLLSLTLFIIL